jgi:hypothetical protein
MEMGIDFRHLMIRHELSQNGNHLTQGNSNDTQDVNFLKNSCFIKYQRKFQPLDRNKNRNHGNTARPLHVGWRSCV